MELTATPANNPKKPAQNSNVLYKVSVSELKAEEMIKLPITLVEHQTWEDAAESAVQQRNRLEKLAAGEPDYIRPIALFQAENKDKDVTAETVREYLVNEAHIPEEQIAVATGEKHELRRKSFGAGLSDSLCHYGAGTQRGLGLSLCLCVLLAGAAHAANGFNL